jgi:NAD(P)-dependent dehydrogenase (short-subunit alcohol dehydrogenase family)
VLSDLNQEACERTATSIGAFPVAADVGREEDVANLVSATIDRFGRIDLFVSNAGIAIDGGIDTPAEKWQQIFDVNVMSEVFAAKHVIPHMLEQGRGYLLNTASAPACSDLRHRVLHGDEARRHRRLAATYGDQDITVSLLCPAGVRTPILTGKEGSPQERDVITTDNSSTSSWRRSSKSAS